MAFGELPKCLKVNNKFYDIRTNYLDIINILTAFADPELENKEKLYICLYILFVDFDEIPQSDYQAAFNEAVKFIDNGIEDNNTKSPRLMDWEQDEKIMLPAINKVAGFDIRTKNYIHWWTFLGYYMEISDGVFSNVLLLRNKKAKGKPLESYEKEFWNSNRDICVLKPKLTKEEKEEKEALWKMLTNS